MKNEKQTPKNKAQRLQTKLARKHNKVEHDPKIDSALLVAYQNGDEEAGWSLFESYSDVASIVYRFPSKPPHKTEKMAKLHYQPLSFEDKEDLFQEIAYNFFELAMTFDTKLAPPFEHAVRAKLHQRVFNRFFSEFIEIETHETVLDEETDFEAKTQSILLEEEEVKKLPKEHIELYQGLNQLTASQREVVIMKVVNGWNSTEVGRELGVKPKTAQKTFERAMKKLREIMINEEEKS